MRGRLAGWQATGQRLHLAVGGRHDSNLEHGNGQKHRSPCRIAGGHSLPAVFQGWLVLDQRFRRCKEVRKIEAHKGLIIALAISPDGKFIASAGADLAIQIRELETGKVVKAFVGGKNRLRTLAFSPDGTQLLAGGEDQVVSNWNVATGSLLWTLELQSGWIEKVAFMPNGNFFFACARNKMIIGKIDSGEIVRVLKTNVGGVSDLVFSPDNKTFATCGNDGQLFIVGPGEKMVSMKVSEGNANQLVFSPDGRTIYVGCGGRYDNETKTFTPIGLGVQRVDLNLPEPPKNADLPLGTPLNPEELRYAPKK
jgi:WD40 repeat protein